MAAAPTSVTALASSNLSAPAGTYIYSVVRSSPTSLAAISSDDCLRTLDPTTLQVQSVIPNAHKDGITSLTPVTPGILATSGRDGLVKLWDPRQPSQPAQIFQNDGSNIPILSLAVAGNTLAFGTEHPEFTHTGGDILVFDVRSPRPRLRYTESHNDDVTELRFHPTHPHILLSGSTDALLNVYNLLTPASAEKAVADDDVENALHQVINHGSSVHRAGFLDEKTVWGLSHDETMGVYRLHDTAEGEAGSAVDEKKEFGDLRTPLGCEYVVDVVGRAAGGGAYIAAGNHSNSWVDLVPLRYSGSGLEGWALGTGTYRLAGAHAGEIVRSVLVDDVSGTVFTAAEDGLVMAWRPQMEMPVVIGGEGEGEKKKKEKKEKKDRKEKKKEKKKEKHFKPY